MANTVKKDKEYHIKLASYRRYIMFLEDLLGVDGPFVVFKFKGQIIEEMGRVVKKDYGDFCSDDVKGRYYPYENVLFINVDLHTNQEEFLTITHEFRHAYQCLALESYTMGDEWEEPSILELWKDNMKHVISNGEQGYFDQPLEVDAFAFTDYIVRNVFGVPMQIYEEHDKTLYASNFERISNEFTKEEIQESLSYVGFAFLS